MNGHSRRNFLFQAAVAAVPLGAFGARRPQQDDFTGMNANAADKSQIFDALAAGDDTAVLELLEQTPVLRFARDGNGQSLLLASAIMGRATVIQKLTDSGVAPDVYEAAALGLVDHVTSLLKEYPGLVRLPNLNGETPMHLAALCGHADIVANSMIYGEDFNLPSTGRGGATVMHLGAQLKSAPVAEDIAFSTIGNGGNPNLATHSGDTVLHTAARAGHERVVKLCLQRSSNPDARNSQGEAPIDLARKSGSRAAVALLEDQATITRAHAEQRFAYTRGLKKASWVQPDGIPQEMTNHTVLFCHFGFDEVKKMISLCPALVNSKASWDELPVEAAAHMGREDIASYLLDREALYSICTATMFGDLATVKTLLQTDKDSLWERGAHHYPVLWYTAFGNERVEIASYLINRGADLRDDIRGRTVLHVAAASGHIDLCRLLLERGADPNQNGMTMKGERTPIQIAVEEKHPETASLLRTWYSQ